MRLEVCVNKIFRLWSIFLVGLFVLSPTNISAEYKIYGICSFFVIFMPWAFLGKHKEIIHHYNPVYVNGLGVLALIAMQIICAHYSISYYTGNTVVGALSDTFSGTNVYQSYQDHFKLSGIAQVPLWQRSPAIISLALVKFTFLLTVTLFFTRSIKLFPLSQLIAATVIYACVGLARGTFFEIFEILIAYIYIGMASGYLKSMPLTKKRALKASIFSVVAAAPILFIINTVRRYEGAAEYFSKACGVNFCFSSMGINYYVEYAIFILSNYFSMGLFFLAHLASMIFEQGKVSILIPLYYEVVEVFGTGGIRGLICSSDITCKFVWVPDVMIIISIFGVLAPIFIALFFDFIRKLERAALVRYNLYSLPFIYTVLLFILSLPVGNFYTVSSSTILCSGAFFLLWRGVKKTRWAHIVSGSKDG